MQISNNTETLDFLDQVKTYFQTEKTLYGEDLYLDYDFQNLLRSESEKKRDVLLKLFFHVKECRNCDLAKSRKKFVFGSGNPSSRIMLIGEAPGANEDLQGKPFVGEAGKLLDKILAAIKLTRNDIFLTNILKCRPPQNRDPLPDEVVACESILLKQIEILKPEFILIVGRIAAHYLLKTTAPLRELRGKVVDVFNAKAIVTYHPSALLREPGLKRSAWEDVQLFQKLYEQG
ncbi:uracil-DNA glycosylase [candidate division KSB1 bacterium]|nr:uracil-DNA glycosylase [candidate division KSB1 bacterium]MBL7094486.1 uracil-DNA glycosylase [candidate division KSB1 bacterium]